ncbi:hypothetical protein [Flavobacterium caeni]|uniref:Universal stress protein family protein n=1 Tax=Flavobacterium caeni TaxID=490189 RepID=A0A1G5I9U4_9FLAO|nr:hypothetical protein [Flavobacterium caeni]SCY72048.1 hypothetical protein SAMN02927903_02148 [Flavobacterium caeni]
MKNILIPTTLQKDTVQAVRVALADAADKPLQIVLMTLEETPDVASAAYWLRKSRNGLDAAQEAVFAECLELAEACPLVKIKMQRQFSMTKPLLRNFTAACEISLSIIPNSFVQSSDLPHRHFLHLLKNSKTPILQLTPECEDAPFTKALFIENTKSQVQAKDVAQLVGGHFSFRIVSQARPFDEANHEELLPALFDAISKNGIDLLIETRKPQKVFGKTSVANHENLGLPVLSVCEPAY